MITHNIQLLNKLSVIGSMLFIFLLILLHILEQEIDPTWQPISEYALGRQGWLMRLVFFSMAVATGAATVISLKFYRKTLGRIGAVLLTISSVGFLIAGIFNTDPASTLNENMTTTGTLHSIGAGFSGMLVFASLFFVWQSYKNPVYRETRKPLAYATILLWFSEVVLIISMAIYLPKNNGNLGPEVLIGWAGRFMIICAAIWVFLFTKHTIKIKE
ncbi:MULTISPECIES: DUF998 domain-containing protein [unclassified Sphingobacterium]|uniref:DUF998 domain-containing protein n=1 Tax=unclassified Sphingobacterium TaxID=2609468 RepID=UPI0025D711DD|nr:MULTISPECIES: DUF998 domain-containing protein [unclassified Sphingobacterium]